MACKPEQREPLLKAIQKWRKIEQGKLADLGANNCALCQVYKTCEGCPVYERTGYAGCEGTPWEEWNEIHISNGRQMFRPSAGQRRARAPELKELARKERKFLESLL